MLSWHGICAVFIGGGLGALARAYISLHNVPNATSFYGIHLGTLWANYLGCFGLALALQVVPVQSIWRMAICTGFMGGLTTFSTLSYENFDQLQTHGLLMGLLHLCLHYIGGMIWIFLGFYLGTWIVSR